MVIRCSNALLTNGAPDRKVQKPPLAMLSGQKSALESIQATGDICTLLCASSPAKAPFSPGALVGRDGEVIYILKGDTSIFEGF